MRAYAKCVTGATVDEPGAVLSALTVPLTTLNSDVSAVFSAIRVSPHRLRKMKERDKIA